MIRSPAGPAKMSALVEPFVVLACAAVAACAAAIVAMSGLKGRARAVFAWTIAATGAVLLLGCRGITCTNDLSSYNLARSVVEARSFQLDRFVTDPAAIDLSSYGNHFYSDRPPLTGWLAAIPYAATTRAGRALPSLSRPEDAVLLIPIVATLLTAVVLVRLSMRLGSSEDAAVLTVLVFAFASPAFVYGRVLFVHAVSVALVAGGCLALLGPAPSRRALFTAGLLFGFSVAADYSNGVLVAIAGSWLMLGRHCPIPRLQRLALFAGGLVLPACVLMAYNDACFGSPFTLSYSYCTFPWARTFGGTFSGGFVDGLLGLTVRPPTGIFVWSPIAVVGVAGLLAAGGRGLREQRILPLALFAGLLLIMAKHRTWYGGATGDARYLSSAFPLLLPGIALAGDRFMGSRGRATRALVGAVVAGSVVLRWAWATRVIECVRYTRPPLLRSIPFPVVLLVMLGAVAIWFLAGSRPSTDGAARRAGAARA